MTAMDMIEVKQMLRDLLFHNIPDPNPPSSGVRQWIQFDHPRSDATFPRLVISKVSSAVEHRDQQEQMEVRRSTYQIDVWVKPSNSYATNGNTYTGNKLKEYLVNRIMETVKSSANTYDIVAKEVTGQRDADEFALSPRERLDLLRGIVEVTVWHEYQYP
ncbi:MAG: hypothetical protein ACXQTL_06000 [Methanosarcinales archaeon]